MYIRNVLWYIEIITRAHFRASAIQRKYQLRIHATVIKWLRAGFARVADQDTGFVGTEEEEENQRCPLNQRNFFVVPVKLLMFM
jgi:hypothetical protein